MALPIDTFGDTLSSGTLDSSMLHASTSGAGPQSTMCKACKMDPTPSMPADLNKRRGAPRDGEGQCAGCDRL